MELELDESAKWFANKEKRETELHAAQLAEYADCKRVRQEQVDLDRERHERWQEHSKIVEQQNKNCATLSFRDQCAIAAIPIIEHYLMAAGKAATDDNIAEGSFDLADAMELERQKRNGK